MAHTFNPSIQKEETGGSEFEVYRLSSTTVRATTGNPISKDQNPRKKQKPKPKSCKRKRVSFPQLQHSGGRSRTAVAPRPAWARDITSTQLTKDVRSTQGHGAQQGGDHTQSESWSLWWIVRGSFWCFKLIRSNHSASEQGAGVRPRQVLCRNTVYSNDRWEAGGDR